MIDEVTPLDEVIAWEGTPAGAADALEHAERRLRDAFTAEEVARASKAVLFARSALARARSRGGASDEDFSIFSALAYALWDLRPHRALSTVAAALVACAPRGFASLGRPDLRRLQAHKNSLSFLCASLKSPVANHEFATRVNDQLGVLEVTPPGFPGDARSCFELVRYCMGSARRKAGGSDVIWATRGLYCIACRVRPEMVGGMTQAQIADLWGVSKEVISNQSDAIFEPAGMLGGVYGGDARAVFRNAQMGNMSWVRGNEKKQKSI